MLFDHKCVASWFPDLLRSGSVALRIRRLPVYYGQLIFAMTDQSCRGHWRHNTRFLVSWLSNEDKDRTNLQSLHLSIRRSL